MTSSTRRTCHPCVARTMTVCVLALVGLTPGCSETPIVAPGPGPAPGPPPGPTTGPFAAPVVTAVSERVGSIGGGADVTIEGAGFLGGEGGPVVTFGGVHATRVVWMNATIVLATAPPHHAGAVDVAVHNNDGQSARLESAYTYVTPDTFDPNGEWEGWGADGRLQLRFTIQDGKLTAVSCDTSGTRHLAPAPLVSNGEFTVSLDGKVVVEGRLVSELHAIGTISLSPCTATTWTARKQ